MNLVTPSTPEKQLIAVFCSDLNTFLSMEVSERQSKHDSSMIFVNLHVLLCRHRQLVLPKTVTHPQYSFILHNIITARA